MVGEVCDFIIIIIFIGLLWGIVDGRGGGRGVAGFGACIVGKGGWAWSQGVVEGGFSFLLNPGDGSRGESKGHYTEFAQSRDERYPED